MYKNIHEKVINLNEKYDKIRKKLCLPKVYDLSSKDYDYEKAKKLPNNREKWDNE